MNNKNFEVYVDCGSSKIRFAAFSKNNSKNSFYYESNFFLNHSNIDIEIQKIISSLELNTNEYLDNVSLLIDDSKILTIGISILKKLDGLRLQKEDIQFLIQDAKQQISRNYVDKAVIHIIIKKYKIDGIEYDFLPDNKNCNLVSLDILFICLPKDSVEYYKNIFYKLHISVNQIFCTSYVKSINYKDNFSVIDNLSFIDMGFNKTSINCYFKNEIVSIDVLPIGGNHITKDISKILKINLDEAEKLKLSFDKNEKLLNKKKISAELIQQIIFARIEEILELSAKSIRLNLDLTALNKCKIVLMGEGSKILDNKFKDKISFSNDIDLLDETIEDILESALKLGAGLNKQEVLTVPKKLAKQGFFEKLFHLFK
tara:strand:+ start:1345 stop:2460 length:1116 start_codon:yes stop_codon:yes gene_type:complete